MPVHEITSESQFNNFLNDTKGNKYIFVDFYTQWCPPCKKIAPHIEKLSEMHPRVTFLKVDVGNEKFQSLSAKYSIGSVPTFLIFKVGVEKPTEPIIGADTKKIETALQFLTTDMEIKSDF